MASPKVMNFWKSSKYNKVLGSRLCVSRTIYVNVDSPNLGFTYFNFSGEAQCKKTPCITNQLTKKSSE